MSISRSAVAEPPQALRSGSTRRSKKRPAQRTAKREGKKALLEVCRKIRIIPSRGWRTFLPPVPELQAQRQPGLACGARALPRAHFHSELGARAGGKRALPRAEPVGHRGAGR